MMRIIRIGLLAAIFCVGCVLISSKLPKDTPGLPSLIGYAFCHQQPNRSPFAMNHDAAFCFRCTGLFLGAFWGLLWQWPQKRAAKLFTAGYFAWIIITGLFFVIDSLNASVFLRLLNIEPFYSDQPFLRTASGFGLGIGLAITILPIFNRFYYCSSDLDQTPLKQSWQKAGLAATFIILWIILSNSKNGLIMMISWMTAISALTVLSLLYAILVQILWRSSHCYRRFWNGRNLLTLGFFLAIVQIVLTDLFRYQWTGTWGWPF